MHSRDCRLATKRLSLLWTYKKITILSKYIFRPKNKITTLDMHFVLLPLLLSLNRCLLINKIIQQILPVDLGQRSPSEKYLRNCYLCWKNSFHSNNYENKGRMGIFTKSIIKTWFPKFKINKVSQNSHKPWSALYDPQKQRLSSYKSV